MNNEQILNMMGCIDPALIESADGGYTKKHMPRTARVGLIAACLCALMVGTAFAAESLMGASIREYFSGDAFVGVQQSIDPMYPDSTGDEYSGYVIQRQGSGVSFENVSAEVLEQFGQSAKKESIRFDSMSELEQYLGQDIYDNAVLEELEQFAYIEYPELYEYDGGVLVPMDSEKNYGAVLHCAGDAQGLKSVETTSYWGLDNGSVSITVSTEAIRSGNLDGDVAYVSPDGTVFTEEAYTTVSGGEVRIIRSQRPDTGDKGIYGTEPMLVSYTAHFYMNGVRYCVDMACANDTEAVLQLMKDILDAFEFSEIS